MFHVKHLLAIALLAKRQYPLLKSLLIPGRFPVAPWSNADAAAAVRNGKSTESFISPQK